MKKKNTLSLLIVVGLLVSIPMITGVLQKSGFELRISALENDEPVNVIVSDVKNDSFTVVWITERETIGGIVLSDGVQFMEDDKASYHLVDVEGLNPSTNYTFKLMSGSKKFEDEDGGDYSVTTASVSTNDGKFLIYGQVFSADGYSFQQGGIISLELSDSLYESQTVSAVINETGGYQFDLGGLLSSDLSRNYTYRQDSSAKLVVYVSHEQQGIEKFYNVNLANNRQIPNIYLGEVNIDIIPAIDGTE